MGDKLMRLGILGGTFDPPHIGHLILAQCALEQADLDQVLFIPAGQPPYKLTTVVASPEQRLAMTERAVAGNPNFAVSEIEVSRPGVSYTIDTVRALKAAYGEQTRLFLITGSDSSNEISGWKNASELLRMVELLQAERAAPKNAPAAGQEASLNLQKDAIQMPALAISSTELRQALAEGRSIRYLVSDTVLDYIRKHALYGR